MPVLILIPGVFFQYRVCYRRQSLKLACCSFNASSLAKCKKDKHPFPHWSADNLRATKDPAPCRHHKILPSSVFGIEISALASTAFRSPSRSSGQRLSCRALRVTALSVEQRERQPNRPAGGARLSGSAVVALTSALSFRWPRICLRACPVSVASAFGITTGSSMQVMTLTVPPHSL